MRNRWGSGILATAMLATVGCPPAPPVSPTVPQGTSCAQLVIACYDEFAHTPANLACFLPASRWNRTDLRWKLASFLPNVSQSEQLAAAERAFATWSTASSLTLHRVEGADPADIVLEFADGEHDDLFPFDGAGNVLGHAYFPSSASPGAVHIDAAGVLATNPDPGEFALYTVLLHEIGHSLGLEHDLDSESVMAPSYHVRADEGLASSDVLAIQRLYGSLDGSVAPLAILPAAECDAPPGDLTALNPDTDGDGIPDTIEVFVLGTDFDNVDTDGDGVSDYDEVFRDGTPPNHPISEADPDDDADFLALSLETRIGTDPSNSDTDGDGLLDGLEVFRLGTDPLKADTDGDQLNDEDDPAPTNANFAGNTEPPRPLPDCNDNGIRDDIDLADGTSADCNENGVPDACEIVAGDACDANGNGRLDECDAGNVCTDGDLCTMDDSEDCVCLHVAKACDDGVFCNGVETCDGGDCLPGLPPCTADETCEEATGLCVPPIVDGGGGGGGGGTPPPPDCNGNGVADGQDLAQGTSADCNSNSVPDECDTQQGTSPDCNGNRVPDACDILTENSIDSNENGVPDECEIVVLFVNQGANGANDGSSWANGFLSLTGAINKAGQLVEAGAVGVEIWVAKGVYFPTVPGVGKRSDSFRLLSRVSLYGGFAGFETSRDARSLATIFTVLSGDFTQNDAEGSGLNDNSFHVVDGSNADGSAVLDGFVITAGNAGDEPVVAERRGGGLRIVDGSPVIRHCTFRGNVALRGGAVSVVGGSPSFYNTVFTVNRASLEGGAIVLEGSAMSAFFGNCTVALNVAGDGAGGGIYVSGGTLNMANSVVAVNVAFGGASADAQIFGAPASLNISYSFIQNSPNVSGVGNIGLGLDPGFVGGQTVDVHLAPGSRCIDAGDNFRVPAFLGLDRDGGVRIVDDPQSPNTGSPTGAAAIVDMGAFEFSAQTDQTIPRPGP